jgi:hypothetical protein
MYALNYMINIYCLRMSDISGAAQTQSQRLLIFTPPPPPVVSKVGQKTTSATNVVITDQPMSGCCLLRFSSSLVSVCCRLFSVEVFRVRLSVRCPHWQIRYFWNNAWMIQSSISTVGYGDQ